MRHRVYGRRLGRNKDGRDRLLKGLVSELLLHGTIETSAAKAKAIKGLVDKMINRLKPKDPKFASRTSGYTSVARIGPRSGDQTMMVRMSLLMDKVESPKVKKRKTK